MKEVVVMLSLILTGHFSAVRVPALIDRYKLFEDGKYAASPDPRLQGFDSDRPISREDMQKYNKLYGVPDRPNTGFSCSAQHRNLKSRRRQVLTHSQPSSLMSVTSNPSERSASPAIF